MERALRVNEKEPEYSEVSCLSREGNVIDKTKDLRWIRFKTGELCTWKETLMAMCRYYGTFAGRYHSNEFWIAMSTAVSSMTEEECEAQVRKIESEADAALAYGEFFR